MKTSISMNFYKSTENPAASSRLLFSSISKRIDFFVRRISGTKNYKKPAASSRLPKNHKKSSSLKQAPVFR